MTTWQLRSTTTTHTFADGAVTAIDVTQQLADETDARSAYDEAARNPFVVALRLTGPDGIIAETAHDQPLVRATTATTLSVDGLAEYDEIADTRGNHWFVRSIAVRHHQDRAADDPTRYEPYAVQVTDTPDGGICDILPWGTFRLVADGAAARTTCPHGTARYGDTAVTDNEGITACCGVPATCNADGSAAWCRCCESTVTAGEPVKLTQRRLGT